MSRDRDFGTYVMDERHKLLEHCETVIGKHLKTDKGQQT